MGVLRGAAVAALSTSLILLINSVPAFADEPDTTPPVLTSTGLTEGQVLKRQPTFEPVFSDNVGVLVAEVLVNGELNRGHYFRDYVTRPVQAWLGDVPDGSEADITVRVYDAARNSAELTTRVRVDNTAPSSLYAPAEDVVLPRGVTTIKPVDAPDDLASLVLSDPSGAELSRVTAAPWELRWQTPDSGDFAAVTVVATDVAGNQATEYLGYRLDRTGPDIEAGPNWIRETVGADHQVLAVWSPDEADVARVEWWIDGALRGTGWSINYDFGRVSRTVPVEVRAYDPTGNVTTVHRQVRVDATGPAVTWVTPANGALVRGYSITSAVRATDANGVSRATLNGWEAPLGAENRRSVRVGEGANVLTWVLYDDYLNTTTVRRTVIVDNTPPALKVTKAPKDRAKVKGTVKVSAAASDRNGVARVELLVNGKVVARDYRAGYQFSVNTRKYGKKIKVQLRAYDRAGNVRVTAVRVWRR
ncbi:Ig-like domain-containing protein [Actinoplanes sp. NPDC051861]|uniref:Ig-like domain-containing protein n=1 Tax=Actinoplanes sp. NPDC051861 TaxID=3155170 RepID=UPI003429FD36